MRNGDPWTSHRAYEGIALLLWPEPDVAPAIAEARDAMLRAWVAMVRDQYAHLWPAPGVLVGRDLSRPPWPDCWERHAGFVAVLRFLKWWADAIEAGEAPGGYREARDWLVFLRHGLAPTVHDISGRTCRHGHLDPGEARGPQVTRPAARRPRVVRTLVRRPLSDH